MNIYYAKAILYAYPEVDELVERIDELVYKKAVASMNDFSPAEEQCERVIRLTEIKKAIIKMKLAVEKALSYFTPDELMCFEYKYFRKKSEKDFTCFDSSSRAYFRKQVRIANKFAQRVEKAGMTDEIFRRDFLSTEFFRELLKIVIEREKSAKSKAPAKKVCIERKLKKTA